MEPTLSVPSPSLFDLSGRHVLITGASRGQSSLSLSSWFDLLNPCLSIPAHLVHVTLNSGIGAACAIALAQAGAALCLVLREPHDDAPPNLCTVNAIRDLGATAESVYCNLDHLDSVRGVFQKALDAMGGRIDVLVNCAGIQRRSPSLDFSETDWDDVRPCHAPYPSFLFLNPAQSRCHIYPPDLRLLHLSAPTLSFPCRF